MSTQVCHEHIVILFRVLGYLLSKEDLNPTQTCMVGRLRALEMSENPKGGLHAKPYTFIPTCCGGDIDADGDNVGASFPAILICALKDRKDAGLLPSHACWRSGGRRVYTSDVRHITHNDTQNIKQCSALTTAACRQRPRSSHLSKVCEHGARRGHCSSEQVQNRKET
ncbi:hypothetical protein B0T13DRAFT_464334 [Neurospora crassa]|nr:hypothetical protein B0T13DRAFT_464334 [Neurospora crassa]